MDIDVMPSWEDIWPKIAMVFIVGMVIFGVYDTISAEMRRDAATNAFIEETMRDCELEYQTLDSNDRMHYIYGCPDGTKREFSKRL